MTTRACVYLAGTGVFRPRAALYGQHLKSVAHEYGLTGLFPLDNEIAPEPEDPFLTAAKIFTGNIALMRRADAVVADISPFRGPNMDPGTAMEIGFMTALGKPCFAWSKDRATLFERTSRALKEKAQKRDRDGLLIEDFGLVENLMIAIPAGRIHGAARDAFAAAAEHFIPKAKVATG